MWVDLAKYIIQQCSDKDKVVEVGVGKFFKVADYIKLNSNLHIILTDVKPMRSDVVKDDITSPNIKIYENAKIIYSIRPPIELYPYLIKIAEKTSSKLIIRPLSTESYKINGMRLINYGKASFYEYSRDFKKI